MNKHTLAGLPLRVGQDLLRIKFPLILTAVYFAAAFLLTGEICPLRILTGFPASISRYQREKRPFKKAA